MTVAISLLIHGEAVRFNRGRSRGDDYDFKHMRGRDGNVFPYVSGQCYKKYWRESLLGPFSPITREEGKNQAYTSGDPMAYVDDDLFGYMIAGATDREDDSGDSGASEGTEDGRRVFEAENLKDPEALKRRFLDGSALSNFILQNAPDAAASLQDPTSAEELNEALLNLLDEAARRGSLLKTEGAKATKQNIAKFKKPIEVEEIRRVNREILLRTFSRELQEKPKRDTTRRTAPVRMHALVAFSGIKTAKDFQTFSRDIAYTGKNSIVNPAAQGIYSGWLRTRILIESHRIGKFYVGKNLDLRKDQVAGVELLKEPNPYSREQESVEFVQLDPAERTRRLRAALRALADIGNRQGPASGALHDGSLRPRAFIAGMMKCADSPFDYIWTGRNDDSIPCLDVNVLRDSIKDWEDLFATNRIYVGLPPQAGAGPWDAEGGETTALRTESPASDMKEIIEDELKKIGFEAVVDMPRKALLRLSEEAAL